MFVNNNNSNINNKKIAEVWIPLQINVLELGKENFNNVLIYFDNVIFIYNII